MTHARTSPLRLSLSRKLLPHSSLPPLPSTHNRLHAQSALHIRHGFDTTARNPRSSPYKRKLHAHILRIPPFRPLPLHAQFRRYFAEHHTKLPLASPRNNHSTILLQAARSPYSEKFSPTLLEKIYWVQPIMVQMLQTVMIKRGFLKDEILNSDSKDSEVGRYAKVGTMMAKESVKKRLMSEEGISYTEFTYQLLQGGRCLWTDFPTFAEE